MACLTFSRDPSSHCTEESCREARRPELLQPSWGEVVRVGKVGRKVTLFIIMAMFSQVVFYKR